MLIRTAIIGSITLSLSSFGSAAACEFHGAGFGPPGSGWQAYYGNNAQSTYNSNDLTGWAEDQIENADNKTEAELFQRRPVLRPTFSNAATRAAKTAKSRLSLNSFQRKMGLQVIDQLMRKQASNSYR